MMRFNKHKFKSLREALMTQTQLAERLEIEQSAVTQWETGKYKPSPRRYAAIAAALGCQVSDFCDAENRVAAKQTGVEGGLTEAERLLLTLRVSPELRLIVSAYQNGDIEARMEMTSLAVKLVAAMRGKEKEDEVQQGQV